YDSPERHRIGTFHRPKSNSRTWRSNCGRISFGGGNHLPDKHSRQYGAAVKDKVLVIDDEDSIRFGLTKLLTQAGYECVTASSASEGFQFFTSHNPSVVLLDFKLPDTEGLEFMHKLKDTDPYVAIIMMTAYGTIETAVTALKSGAENFLTKPIDPDGLLVLLKKTLEINEIKRRSDYS